MDDYSRRKVESVITKIYRLYTDGAAAPSGHVIVRKPIPQDILDEYNARAVHVLPWTCTIRMERGAIRYECKE